MSTPKRGLGRGLGALISAEPLLSTEGGEGVIEVPVDAVSPNPSQPRQTWDAEALTELADSIREHGLIQPLIVTRSDLDKPGDSPAYQLVAGERRWRAAKLAGLATVPVILREASSRQQLEWALVENLQRSDLNALEAAGAYRRLIDDFDLTQEQVAEQVGKSRAAVANALRLLHLPDQVKAAILAGHISEGHARALLGLPSAEEQIGVLAAVRRRHLSVRQTEELVRRVLERRAREAAQEEDQEDAVEEAWRIETQALEEQFRSALGTKVQLSRSRRGGKLVIRFYSEEDLQSLYEIIVGTQ